MAADLPSFSDDQTYLLTGATLNKILNWMREAKLLLTGNLQPDEVGPEGTKIKLDTIDLSVCINGSAQTKKFVIRG